MDRNGRRLAPRVPLNRPVEAELLLCRGDVVQGWIVDEQSDGLGMVFGADDVPCLEDHRACCVGGPVDLWLRDESSGRHPVPVRLAHVTPREAGRTSRAGLAFDVSRMRSEDIAHLLQVWRCLVA